VGAKGPQALKTFPARQSGRERSSHHGAKSELLRLLVAASSAKTAGFGVPGPVLDGDGTAAGHRERFEVATGVCATAIPPAHPASLRDLGGTITEGY
jgi:hypothetical protein